MSDPVPSTSRTPTKPRRGQTQREGLALLAGIVAVMWVLEVVNTIDSNGLDGDGIFARSFGHLWGILTAPFIHASFAHLISNTIPLVFMGVIIALQGAARLAIVTGIVIVIGGLLTWLISPSGVSTIGASGVVFGYATYLLARGFFDRSALELMTGLVVGAVWGAVLIASLVPHGNVSWQGHLSGAIAGVIAAYLLRRERPAAGTQRRRGADTPAGALAK
ncbi:MAG TPA: rhomboid family intramembrane serine protease [Solirubrobacteraceae bacterium]|nr:rhomboid family intramembrane serine protease [Solirubrobacteraceae bacterium]